MDAQEEHDQMMRGKVHKTKATPEMLKQFRAENAKASLQSESIPTISLVEEVMASYQVSREQAEQMIKDFGG